MGEFIRVDNVSFSYDDNRVLNNISLSVQEGEFVALLRQIHYGKAV